MNASQLHLKYFLGSFVLSLEMYIIPFAHRHPVITRPFTPLTRKWLVRFLLFMLKSLVQHNISLKNSFKKHKNSHTRTY